MTLVMGLPLIALVLGAAASARVLRALAVEAERLQHALDGLADLPGQLATLRAETEATGMTARLGPNP